ncbi:MAG: PHP domain-containing protein [Bdellovibrio sp.]|nr:PHP domain-containing protein [Bdellovibrio sp.]
MKKKYLVDLHIHSHFSDGKLSIAEIVDLYGAKGFSIIALTDHLADSKTLTGFVTCKLKLSLTSENMDLYLQTIRNEARRAWQKYGMLLIAGAEVTLNSWSRQKGAHLVFLGIDQYINPNQSIEEILIENRQFFSIAAHPLWEKSYEFKTTYLWENRECLASLFDAWECGTANFFSKEVYLSGLPIVASSDFHGPTRFESWKTAAYLEELSTDCLFDSIKNRHVEPVWI